ncbi:MAG: DUF4012 domain-containing protein [Acidimicrobiia bacterium]
MEQPVGYEASHPTRPARRRRRWIVLVVVLVALVWTAIAGYQLVRAKTHAQAGLDRLKTAQRGLDPAGLIRGKALPTMRDARAEFDQASSSADSPLLTPFEFLPVVGRQVRSVQALTNGASTVVHVGVDAMERSTKELADKTHTGPDRVELLHRLGAIGRTAASRLRTVGLGPGNALIGPLASARAKFATELHKAQRTMGDVAAASSGMAEMAQGPSKYLVLAANNGEMRSGSGMLLSVGVLTTDHGSFSLGEMQSVTDFELPAGAVPVPGDYGRRWGWLGPSEDWRYLAMSPQFDKTASLAAQMWKAKTGETVDGVLALDALALRALVKVSGPVDVAGQRIDAGNVVHEILFQQYQDYPSIPDNLDAEVPLNQARRERNGVIARAIVQRLDLVGWDIASMVDDLRSATRGRHLLFWSSHPSEQRAWKAAGVSGILPRDGLMVSVANRGGNKLDQFLAVGADIAHHRVANGSEVTMTVKLANLAPGTGINRYIEGPYPGSGFQAGEYRGILSIDMPAVASDVHLDGVKSIVANGPQDSTRVISGDIALVRGQTAEFRVRFTVPRGYTHLEVVPSARYPAVHYTAASKSWDDDEPRSLRW